MTGRARDPRPCGKHRRYHDDWPTADEAEAWTNRRRTEWREVWPWIGTLFALTLMLAHMNGVGL